MSRVDMYKHLNDRERAGVLIGIEEIAVQLEEMNYGTHRMLSAIIRARRTERPNDDLAAGIEALLEGGLF